MSKDGYAKQIDRLMGDRSEEGVKARIAEEWGDSIGIFDYLSPDRSLRGQCGCVSMVKRGAGGSGLQAGHPAVTAWVRNNALITDTDPSDVEFESPEDMLACLDQFAEAHRMADNLLGREPYVDEDRDRG